MLLILCGLLLCAGLAAALAGGSRKKKRAVKKTSAVKAEAPAPVQELETPLTMPLTTYQPVQTYSMPMAIAAPASVPNLATPQYATTYATPSYTYSQPGVTYAT